MVQATFLLAVCLFAVLEVVYGRPSVHLGGRHKNDDIWIPTWGNMPQLTEPANLPSPPFVSHGNLLELSETDISFRM